MEILNTLFGAFFLVFTWWLAEKNAADKKDGKVNWKQWASKNWDDALYALICGVVLGYYRKELVYLYIKVRELSPDPVWDTYNDLETFVLFGLGFFGTTIIKLLITLGSKFTSSSGGKAAMVAILLSFGMVAIAGPGIKQIKKDGNYIVLTDTTTSRIEWRYPAKDLRYEVQASQYVVFYGRSDRRVGSSNYNIDSLVNASDAAFANLAALETFLQDSTSGFSSAGASASPTVYSNYTGWADYADGTYTSGSPFSVTLSIHP